MSFNSYCPSTQRTERFKTRKVMVGNVAVGGNSPIRIQSMTTSDTRNVEATVEQAMRLADAGCEIVRVTVQGRKEALACEAIKNTLIQKGYTVPLVADIHFYPPAAMTVVDFVDKVRINPGNFVDRRASFKTIEYDDESYANEILKIEEKFSPLVEKCKRLKRAMRIGTNHGSLSDRIMNRYGDSPIGMVHSALEFANICRQHDYHNFMFSMKASNTRVMIEAYRRLVAAMIDLGWDYPLHLGVTEAGEGNEGRIKSAIGIGSLLMDGIGDTIRVSLTEDPWNELDPCQRIIKYARDYSQKKPIESFEETQRDYTQFSPRKIKLPNYLHRDGSVIVSVKNRDLESDRLFKELACQLKGIQLTKTLATVDAIIVEELPSGENILRSLETISHAGIKIFSELPLKNSVPIKELSNCHQEPKTPYAIKITNEEPPNWEILKKISPDCIFLTPRSNILHRCRQFIDWIKKHHIKTPIILSLKTQAPKKDAIIQLAMDTGALLCDALGDGVCIQTGHGVDFDRQTAFNILQSSRMRAVKTEFISCPGCGRTLFQLQDVAQGIRERTEHLPGVKIAIMGCIVNGPGEMADADFGYVGSRPGKIDLYVGKTCVEKNIDYDDANDRLVNLIKAHERWVEPEDIETPSKKTSSHPLNILS